jgi:predicted DNA-binding helix-hairpin-helix protein
MKRFKQIKLKDGRKANLFSDEDRTLLRIYHWDDDAARQLQLLKNCGVGTDQIVQKKQQFVTFVDPKTQASTFHMEAVSQDNGGSGYLYLIEVHGVSEEQSRRIDSAEHALNVAAPWYLPQQDFPEIMKNGGEHIEARA